MRPRHGSLESLNVPAWCGLSSKRRQLRPIVHFYSPDLCALEALGR
jgi:hypothetical protein